MIRLALSLIVVLTSLHSSDLNRIVETANVYAKTGFFQEADERYRALLSEGLTRWEQNVVFYNLGTLNLSNGRWEEAIRYFGEVSGGDLPEHFRRTLKANLNLAVKGLADQKIEDEKYGEALVLLSVIEPGGKTFQELKEKLPRVDARDAILTALQRGEEANLEALSGYPKTLAKLASESEAKTRLVLLAAALAAVNRDSPSKEPDAEGVAVLKQAIEEQQRSFDLSFLSGLVDAESPARSVVRLIAAEQSKAVQTAAQFPEAAITMQKEGCLSQVWNRVIPPFGLGLETAKHSEQLLKRGKPLVIVDDYQLETLKLWLSALDNLKLAESAAAPDEQKMAASDDASQLIQTIIEMQLQDETERKRVPQLKEALRPW